MKVGPNSAEIHSNSYTKGLHPQAQGLEPYQHVPYNKQHYRKVLLAMLHASCFIWMVKVMVSFSLKSYNHWAELHKTKRRA